MQFARRSSRCSFDISVWFLLMICSSASLAICLQGTNTTEIRTVVTSNCEADARRLRERIKHDVDPDRAFLCTVEGDGKIDALGGEPGLLYSNDCANAAAALTVLFNITFSCGPEGRFLLSRFTCETAMNRLTAFAAGATARPTFAPSTPPSVHPTKFPSVSPTAAPTKLPTTPPSRQPTDLPSVPPTKCAEIYNDPEFTDRHTPEQCLFALRQGLCEADPTWYGNCRFTCTGCTVAPTATPTVSPTSGPSQSPSSSPTQLPTNAPTVLPTVSPSVSPTIAPTKCEEIFGNPAFVDDLPKQVVIHRRAQENTRLRGIGFCRRIFCCASGSAVLASVVLASALLSNASAFSRSELNLF